MSRIEPFTVTTPAGTLQSAYQVQSLSFQPGIVTMVEIVVPPGPSGQLGFKIAHSNQSVIPPFSDTWIITDNEKIPWSLSDYPTGDAWEFWSYNTDVYDHTVYLRFHVSEIGAAQLNSIGFIDIHPIASAEDSQ